MEDELRYYMRVFGANDETVLPPQFLGTTLAASGIVTFSSSVTAVAYGAQIVDSAGTTVMRFQFTQGRLALTVGCSCVVRYGFSYNT